MTVDDGDDSAAGEAVGHASRGASGAAPSGPPASTMPADARAPLSLRFGNVEVRSRERKVLLGGQPAALGSRAFDLLSMLIELRPRLVTKQEILERVWAGVVVEENNLQTQISTLRKLLGVQLIETIPGRGYRFIAPPGDLASPPARQAAPASSLVPPVQRMTNLAAAAEALFGRGDDLDTLTALVGEHRLVTLLGAGGIGKTRVAQALARGFAGKFTHGVWWVDLACVASAEGIPVAVAHATNLQLGPGDAAAALMHLLEPRETLLVLDNCERLASEIASFVQAAMAAAPRLRIVATSRETLKAAHEQVYRLDPLALPPPDAPIDEARKYSALQLLEHRAAAADRRFALTPANIGVAIRLCRRLDGIALAIEMAAARLPLLGLAEIDAHLADGLRLLRGSSRTAPARQQTLVATLDWSHALLTADERVVLRRLSVFAASFRLDMAQRVAGSQDLDEWSALDALAGLVDKSLVQLEQREPPRYRLLETTRLYAAERLSESGETEAVLQGHAQAMTALADECDDAYWVMPDAAWLARYAPEYEDIQMAFKRACEGGSADVAAATLDALSRLDHLRANLAAIHLHLRSAIGVVPAASPMARARLHLRFSAHFVAGVPQLPKLQSARIAAAAFRELGDRDRLCEALLNVAVVSAMSACFDEALEALALAQPLEQPDWSPRRHWLAASHRTRVHAYRADVVGYRASVRDELRYAELAASPCQAVNARLNLADAALMAGDWDEAIELGRRVVEEVRTLDLPQMTAVAQLNLFAALLGKGDLPSARSAALEALPEAWRNKISGYICSHLSLLAARLSRYESAARLLGYVEAWFPARQLTLEPGEVRSTGLAAELVGAAMSPSAMASLRRAGANLTDTQAHALAEDLLIGSDAGAEGAQPRLSRR
ncbi:winged helix-turn-helix domain-containing protein [Piscinibacter sp. XHJ-5]|uniref:ATP-binding protein n=1 Tax=Piscinibacter sp. XHJ-5 TaxID=3037797 RepID=UPI0032969B52